MRSRDADKVNGALYRHVSLVFDILKPLRRFKQIIYFKVTNT